MRPMSKFEKKFGKYAISNLTTVLIVCYLVGYILQYTYPTVLNYLTLNPYQILFRGQVWRIVTWIVTPPSIGNLFTTLIMLYFYWSLGHTLERAWGTYRYNVYIFSGMLFTILGSFVSMGISYLIHGEMWPIMSQAGSLCFSTGYINMSIFLAFALTFPEMHVLLMFIIPIKVKWMGIVYGIMLVWEFLEGAKVFTGAVILDVSLFSRIAIVSSLLNFIVFFLSSRRLLISPKQVHRRQEFKREVHRGAAITKHKCAICGRTEETNPELEFRFCSKCNGNYEYCQDHLFSHKHVE
ncbi:MAG: hypothetical protein E7293_01060 [Lachnospiraceae bacterium]|nr:hypothetical protein [Lachnospiraceae bacterium]